MLYKNKTTYFCAENAGDFEFWYTSVAGFTVRSVHGLRLRRALLPQIN